MAFTSLNDIQKDYQEILKKHPEWQPEEREFSLHALHALCEESCGLKVRVFSVETDIEFKKGMLLHGKKEIHVYMRQNLSREEKRFVQAKEFAHILIDNKKYWYKFPEKLLEILSASSSEEKKAVFNESSFENSKEALFSEQRASFVALDLLYPPEQRSDDREKLDCQKTTYRRLAKTLGITHSLATRPFSKSYKRDRDFFLSSENKILDMTSEWAKN